MKAILLAAGRGRRLGVDEPKCLIDVAGRSLLQRHIEAMQQAGIEHLTVVTGHGASHIRAALQVVEDLKRAMGKPLAITIEPIFNERFEHGSLVSLHCAIATLLQDGGLWMDADVLYPAKLLRRLVDSEHANAVLLDGRSSEQGEEMMLALKDERVQRIGRKVGDDWDLVGESVGFFKVDAAGAAVMERVLQAHVDADDLDREHEDALDEALREIAFGHERVDDLPWTEIDFSEDVDNAAALAVQVDRPDL
jgi:choline kinase